MKIFSATKAIIGCVHLLPLPGSPLYDGDFQKIVNQAVKEAKIYEKNKLAGIMVENFRDVPFYPDQVGPETVAAMSVAGRGITRAVRLPVGVNVLRNDAKAALAIATFIGAQFIRVNVHLGAVVTDQGIIEGKAYEALRFRKMLSSQVKIFADVDVKHADRLAQRDLALQVKDLEIRGLADAIVVSGKATGLLTDLKDVKMVKENTKLPVIIGSGTNPDNVNEFFQYADGAIVGTYFKKNGLVTNEVDPQRVKKLMRVVKLKR